MVKNIFYENNMRKCRKFHFLLENKIVIFIPLKSFPKNPSKKGAQNVNTSIKTKIVESC